jgi:hypothetical protein
MIDLTPILTHLLNGIGAAAQAIDAAFGTNFL